MNRRLRTLLGIYALGGLALTVIAGLLTLWLTTEGGLTASFYRGSVGEDLLFRRTTEDIDLRFLDDDPGLPRRFFRVRWEGVWYRPRSEDVDVYAGSDDRVLVTIDGRLVLERSLAEGMHTVSRTLPLSAGFHDLVVDYEQYGGGYSLNIQWAPAGRPPRPLDPDVLFPEAPDESRALTNVRLRAVRTFVGVFWLVPPSILFLLRGVPLLIRLAWRFFDEIPFLKPET